MVIGLLQWDQQIGNYNSFLTPRVGPGIVEMIIQWVMFILEVLGQVIAEEQTNLSLHCSFSGLGFLVHIECVE